ncbi:lateral signaling target protein 2 homolog [Rhinophrynus dorsalis]
MLPSVVRRWLNRPKKSDPRLLARFFHVDEEVTGIVQELQCLDLRKDPQNYLVLLTQLHNSQERMLALLEQILEQCVPTKRTQRDYHLKFPDDIVSENMTTHLLFAAELLIGGTYVEVEEPDGVLLRPLAQELMRSLKDLRHLLREQSLEDPGIYPEPIHKALLRYDSLCAEFELRYMSLVVSVKTPEEIYEQQEVVVLFCETVNRALKLGYLNQEMIDDCEPELMISIPRLAIISGLLIYPDGPLNLQKRPEEMCELFSPFYGLLKKIQELLCILTEHELSSLERALCSSSSEDPSIHLSCLSFSSNKLNLSSHKEPGSTTVETSEHPTSGIQSTCENTAVLSPQHRTNSCHSSVDIKHPGPSPGGPGSNTNGSTSANTSNSISDPKGTVQPVPRSPVPAESQDVKSALYSLQIRCINRRSKFQNVRMRYRSDSDMLHRLFVCIAGVADQLQTNFASDLRVILKTVFEAASSKQQEENDKTSEDAFRLADCSLCQNLEQNNGGATSGLPEWVPDSASSQCMSCYASFTLLRRRHHCRSCGKLFCSRCSAYTTSLLHVDNTQPVRVCSHCYHVHCSPQDSHEEETAEQPT